MFRFSEREEAFRVLEAMNFLTELKVFEDIVCSFGCRKNIQSKRW